ncbi:MAG: zinc-binding dehydrogenase [Anaerolineae bacterium]|jgi:NADPH:quinone reductase-like Zn-dependent oxidoreductase|uniref:alcohol dehydrogenase catalytic domain-containing protein n=1 Tax=Candidatus Amarolinea dominans TaxID=3140696 RepID=UPI001D4112F4|nr:zinc-binding dehydrogenase [Anaerolineae bacterium]MBK7199166.1 zinc-binding dehydrogenase [Anaerolineae bacterium]MBK9095914.1 zinc-binding dehydrogenase [Anaerolineae bacterium]MBK9229970.1 zinc-binding dehydrogenase [Anaerolineae bacterium]
MKAVVFYEHGGPEVLQYREDIPVPEIGADDVLVKVRYAALNRLDNFVRRGWAGLQLKMPHILGSDGAGTLAALGERVSGWQIGQRVTYNPTLWCGKCAYCVAGEHPYCDEFAMLGEHAPGNYAEYVRVPARNLLAVPDDADLLAAAAAPVVFVTAWRMLFTKGNLQAGESVLIVGAGGGVNTAAVQLAKFAGATVFVIAGDAAKAEAALALGADWAIDRSVQPNWGKAVWARTNRRGVNVVVDNVGEPTWLNSLRSLGAGGRLLTVGGTAGYNAVTPINLVFARQLHIIGSTMGSQADFNKVMTLIFAGKIKVAVDEVFPLQAYPAALARMMTDQHFGKLVVEIG